MNESLGFIETKGLIAAIEASDVMLKSSEVDLVSKERVRGGLVMVTVTGDVAAVKTAVDAAASAIARLGEDLLVSSHVIARPDSVIPTLLKPLETKPEPAAEEVAIVIEEEPESEQVIEELEEPKQNLRDLAISEWSANGQRDRAIELLNTYTVAELRDFAKENADFPIIRKELYKTSKQKLIEAVIDYFNKE
jgi:microcompartment protein CcmL/EutN